LNQALKNIHHSKYVFVEKQQFAIERLKTALVSEPVLKLYNPNLQKEIHTDASKYGFGAVLLQNDPVDSAERHHHSRKNTIRMNWKYRVLLEL